MMGNDSRPQFDISEGDAVTIRLGESELRIKAGINNDCFEVVILKGDMLITPDSRNKMLVRSSYA